MKQIPNGGDVILAARKRGLRPDEMLIVSFVGRVPEANHQVFANPKGEYDWRWLQDLDVCLYLRKGAVGPAQLMAIARARPRWLAVWDVDQFKGADLRALPDARTIDRPPPSWRWTLDWLPWLPCENEAFAWG